MGVLRKLVFRRRSPRGFLDEPVSRETIRSLIEIAGRSPSWCNTQPWHVLLTEGAGTEAFRAALSNHAKTGERKPDLAFPEAYEGVYRTRRRDSAVMLYESLGIGRGDRVKSAAQAAKNFELFGAPHVAIITTEAALGVYGAVDCGIFVGNFLLAAESAGVGAVPQAAVAVYAPFIRDYFGLPDSRRIVCGISFGWADPSHPANNVRTTRETVDNIVDWFG
nr:nitroreductase [Rhodococcus wratislaviensis]